MTPASGSDITYKRFYITTSNVSTFYFSNNINKYYSYAIVTNINYTTNSKIYTNIFLGLYLESKDTHYLTNYSKKIGDTVTILKRIKTNIVLKDDLGTTYVNKNLTNISKGRVLTNIKTNISYITNEHITNYISITDFSGMDLSGFNLSHLNLAGFNLSRANLSNVNFTGANLTEVDLGGSKTNGANFSNANTMHATFVSFINITNIQDNDKLHLRGVKWMTKATLAGTNYLLTTGRRDDGLSIFSIDNDGYLFDINHLRDQGDWNMRGAFSAMTLALGSNHYLFLGGQKDNGFSVFSLFNNGDLFNITNLNDTDYLKLKGISSIHPVSIGGTNYLLVTGEKDNGFSVFSISDNGRLANITNVQDEGDLKLSGTSSVTSAMIEGFTYLLVTGKKDNGFSVFSMNSNGSVKGITNIEDTGDLRLKHTQSATTFSLLEKTYFVVTGARDNGFSLFSVNRLGHLTNITNIKDSSRLKIKGVKMVIPAVIKSNTYLFVTGSQDNGVSLFSFRENELINIANISDNKSLELKGAVALNVMQIEDNTYLFVAGEKDNGFSVFEVEPATP